MSIAFLSLTVGILTDYAASISMKVDYEAEDGTYTGLPRTRQDGKKTVYLGENDYVTISFRIHSNCSIAVDDVIYFNDGGRDKVNVTLADNEVGSFMTQVPSGVGHPPGELWNILRNSRAVGSYVQLDPVIHLVTAVVNQTGCRGVEIDKITLQFLCDEDPREEGGTPQQSGLSAGEIIAIVSTVLGVPGAIAATITIIACFRNNPCT